jgi:glutamate/tyrosine decarboxylase-like PLP-dependent enzyme
VWKIPSPRRVNPDKPQPDGITLDPDDWKQLRDLGHRMLDDIFDYIEHVRERPVWQPIPPAVRERFRASLPLQPCDPKDAYDEFTRFVAPYATGNVHPGFMGWVHGGGTPIGMLAEMLAAGLNANLGGRDHMPVEVERQIVAWTREMFGFPESASGLFLTGTSMANLLAVVIARNTALGGDVRRDGICPDAGKLRAYTSQSAHICISQAMEVLGLGSAALRKIPVDGRFRMDTAALREAIAQDRANGLMPFLVIGTAGAVDTGAIDALTALSEICRTEKIHFHVDGAFGALAIWSPELAPRLDGIERADSIAFDFHKWGQVPYDAGFLLVRDGERHRRTFASPASYLRRETRGLAAGSPWPSEYGLDLSRGFRALKTWFTLKTYGTERLGAVIARTCALAKYLEHRVRNTPQLELLAPAQLNIVCFRYRAADADVVNARIAVDLHESGIAAPSTTIINGHLAIRAAFVNHRTQTRDVDALVDAIIRLGAV